MRVEEFKTAADNYRKRVNLSPLKPMFVFLLLAASTGIVGKHFAPDLEGVLAPPFAELLAYGTPGLFIALGFAFACRQSVRAAKQGDIVCPHCGKSLVSMLAYAPVVIASKHCPHCGKRVLEDA